MKVICAGLSKIGTKSMAKALRILGYKTYDGPEHFTLHLEKWSDVFLKKKQPDFLSMYGDVDAVTDIPANSFYKEILEAFPDTKVILTERDSEDVWVESWFNQMNQFQPINNGTSMVLLRTLSPTMKKQGKLNDLCVTSILGANFYERGASFLLKKKYREYNEQVKASVPSDHLLVFNVKQGWRPLCEFLGSDIPSCPFPRENVKGSLVLEQAGAKWLLFSTTKGPKIFKEITLRISLIVILVGIVLVMFNII